MFVPLFAVKFFMPFFAAGCKAGTFFGLPHWWQYITLDPTTCDVTDFKVPEDFLAIGLAVAGMLLYVAGIAAIVSIIISGVGFITAGGNAEKAVSARKRIINSFIGLAIVVAASAFVAFVGNTLGG